MIVLAEILGFFLLLPACIFNAWTDADYPSIKPYPAVGIKRLEVDQWSWQWLNYWYANTEDGVSGQQAIIYVDGAGHLGTYASTFPSWTPKWVIAYCWSAWRNGANNIKRPLRTDGLIQAWQPK